MKTLKFLVALTAVSVWLTASLAAPFDWVSGQDAGNGAILDATFGSNGLVITDIAGSDDEAHVVALQPDGKIIVAGRGGRWGIARYNPNGTLDATFDGDGKLAIPGLAGGVSATGVLLQTDGKIIVTGSTDDAANVGGVNFAAVRLNSNGSIDTTFGASGYVRVDVTGEAKSDLAAANSVLQPDGKIIIAGHTIINTTGDNLTDWSIVRLNNDGSLDATFDADGKLTLDFNNGKTDEAFGLALQPDGKIVVAGLTDVTTSQMAVARFNPNGSLDATFDGDGKIIASFPVGTSSFAADVAVQPDGKIIAAGSVFFGNVDDFAAARFNADGSPDQTFDADGKVVISINSTSDRANDVELQSDGKIILSGYSATTNQPSHFTLARILPGGALDASFGSGGVRRTVIRQSSEIFQSIVQPDNKIVSVGITRNAPANTNDFAVVRYDADGTGPTASPTATPVTGAGALDANFDSDGRKILDFAVASTTQAQAEDVAAQPDGKIVIVGQLQAGFDQQFAVARLNADGSFDNGFDADGRLLITFSTATVQSGATAAEIQSDGKILIAGFTNAGGSNGSSQIALARLNANGSLDAAFGSGGKVITVINPLNTAESAVARDVKIQPDGKIIVVGTVQRASTATGRNDFFVVRYNANGSLDTSFDADGRVFTDFTGENDAANSLALQADGKIIVAGNANFASDFAIARYNGDGGLDTTFDFDGKFTANEAVDTGAEVFAVSDNKILLVGSSVLETINPPRYSTALLRLNQNGSFDSTFDNDGKAFVDVARDFLPNAAVLQADGKIVTVGGTAGDFGIARFNANGALDSRFGSAGLTRTDFLEPPATSSSDRAFGAAIQPDGKIIAVGSASNNSGARFAVARYKSITPQSAPNDFDGDGRTDYAVFRAGAWYVLRSSNNAVSSVQFGIASDKPVPADYDADGKTDIAVFRETGSDGFFFILQSSDDAFRAFQFGSAGDDASAVGDWDADGKADLAVYRNAPNANGQSYFYYRPSSVAGADFVALPWGTNGDKPINGDFDGDGKIDAAVYRASDNRWYILQSANNGFRVESWGNATDKRISGDFDGDAKTDLTVFRAGVWYVRRSSDNAIVYQNWGAANDAALNGDFDGDGKTDFTVWRDGSFYVLPNAANGTSRFQPWGAANDVLPYLSNP